MSVNSIGPDIETFSPGKNFNEFGFGVFKVCTNILTVYKYKIIFLKNFFIIKTNDFFIFLIFSDAISLAFCAPSFKTLSIKLHLLAIYLFLEDIGEILSTTKLANFSLNSEKFFPENSLIVLI